MHSLWQLNNTDIFTVYVKTLFERYFASELFSQLLPEHNPDPFFKFDLKVSSAETQTRTTSGGSNEVSPVYEAVSFMRSVIMDQSLDMQMVSSTDNSGNETLVPVNQEAMFLRSLKKNESK